MAFASNGLTARQALKTGARPLINSTTIQPVRSCLPVLAALGKGELDPFLFYSVMSELTQRDCIRVDLTVANHVHLIEPQWNPMVEAQAVDRVDRIGQERGVVITRYIMLTSIETVDQSTTHPMRVDILILSSTFKASKTENYNSSTSRWTRSIYLKMTLKTVSGRLGVPRFIFQRF